MLILKKLLILILVSVLMVTLTGCTKDQIKKDYIYFFKGEGEYWSTEFKLIEAINSYNYKWPKYILIVTYKDSLSNLSSIKKFTYGFSWQHKDGVRSKYAREGITFNEKSPPKDKEFIKYGWLPNLKVSEWAEVIKVTIEWDGQTEIIEAKKFRRL